MSQDGSVFTCKNHPTLRWANTKPQGRIFFMGEIMDDGRLKPDQPIAPIPHILLIKARLNGRNPFAPDVEELAEEPLTDWNKLCELVDGLREQDKKWAFECPCPMHDLITLDDETYESVTNREHVES